MKVRFGVATLAMLMLAAIAFFAATPGSVDAKEKYPRVRKMITRTHGVIVHARHAVLKGGEAKPTFRNAWVHQQAARRAIRKDKPVVAAHLTLKARALARKAIQENKGEMKDEDAKDDAEETKAAEGASEAEADELVKEADKDTPDIEVLIKIELKDED
jgi:hypothetical protein